MGEFAKDKDVLDTMLKNACDKAYAQGWTDALEMAAGLLGRIAKQRKYADANRWVNARGEDGETKQISAEFAKLMREGEIQVRWRNEEQLQGM
jgi:hypothetical protein